MVVSGLITEFQQALVCSKHVMILTGAGVSAESGIPTFRGAGGLWRAWDATALATPQAFARSPSLVWEFYHWRREVVSKAKPNPAHYALAAFQRQAQARGQKVSLVTQNIDRLHQAAGSKDVVELHGSLWDVCRATKLGHRDKSRPCWEDRRQPLVPALEGKGAPSPDTPNANIPVSELPHDEGGHLLRPGVVWFGEALEVDTLDRAFRALEECDFFMTIGTSSVVTPASTFAERACQRGVPVAEFNLEPSGATDICQYIFQGKAGELLPAALRVEKEVQDLMEQAEAP
eukprot:jgi/Botrbrau1/13668/Bobra.0378s0002.1